LSVQPLQGGEEKGYFKVDAGATLPLNFKITELANVPTPDTEASLDPGVRLDLIKGFRLSETVVLELEVGVLYNSFDQLSVKGGASAKLDGNLWQVPILMNAVYSFRLGSKFKPFVGAGVGGVLTFLEGNDFDMTKSDLQFGFQGMAGVKYELSDATEIGVAYKFLGSLSHEFSDTAKTDGIYNNSVLVGFTYRF